MKTLEHSGKRWQIRDDDAPTVKLLFRRDSSAAWTIVNTYASVEDARISVARGNTGWEHISMPPGSAAAYDSEFWRKIQAHE
jgi:hypothetical protein